MKWNEFDDFSLRRFLTWLFPVTTVTGFFLVYISYDTPGVMIAVGIVGMMLLAYTSLNYLSRGPTDYVGSLSDGSMENEISRLRQDISRVISQQQILVDQSTKNKADDVFDLAPAERQELINAVSYP